MNTEPLSLACFITHPCLQATPCTHKLTIKPSIADIIGDADTKEAAIIDPVLEKVDLGWAGLGWVGLGWVGLGWVGGQGSKEAASVAV